jgi:hypothetical protein
VNRELVDRIVAATLYEGYILYPYRPSSVKNQVRWTFGGVYPREYSAATGGGEPWTATTECLLRGGDDATVEAAVRFLHVVTRAAYVVTEPTEDPPAGNAGLSRVDSFELDGRLHRSWEEAAERELHCGAMELGSVLGERRRLVLDVDAGETVEWIRGADGRVAGALVRTHEALSVEVEIAARRVSTTIAAVRVSIRNVTPVSDLDESDRARALRHALVSTHVVLGVTGGGWLSLTDPPPDAVEHAAACVNTGLWPVMVGEPATDDTILASPIILEDHPQVAPESAGELFDSTEIDEILSLRILTLTDEEKAEMRAADSRARAMLDRTESLTRDDFMRMHGTLRSVAPRVGGQQ